MGRLSGLLLSLPKGRVRVENWCWGVSSVSLIVRLGGIGVPRPCRLFVLCTAFETV